MQKTRNLFLLHRGIDTFGANLALTGRQLLAWDSAINSVHVPIEVGKFQSDSSRPNLMIFAILCVKMLPEGILSRLAKKHVIYS